MSHITLFFIISLLKTIFSLRKLQTKTTLNSDNIFTFAYLLPIRIGESLTDIDMLISTKTTENTLFSNTDRPYSKEILTNTYMDRFKDNISLNGEFLYNFTFNVKPDFTNLNISSVQGVFGFGIKNKNPLIDNLYSNNIIHSKEIYLKSYPISHINFAVDISKSEKKKYTFCDITDRDDLSKKYKESFVCEYTHLLLDDVFFNESILINGRVVFDTTSNYIIIPFDYIDMFYEIWELNKSKCYEYDDERNETILYCNFNLLKNGLKDLKNLTFVFDGFGYEIKSEDLFVKINDDTYISLIRFRNEKNNIWTMGFPFFKKYDILFDYEKKRVGIKNNSDDITNNGKVVNYTEEYIKWKEENEGFLNSLNINEKKIMYAGMVIGSIVLLSVLIYIIKKCINNIKNNGENNENKTNVNKKGNHMELIEEINQNDI